MFFAWLSNYFLLSFVFMHRLYYIRLTLLFWTLDYRLPGPRPWTRFQIVLDLWDKFLEFEIFVEVVFLQYHIQKSSCCIVFYFWKGTNTAYILRFQFNTWFLNRVLRLWNASTVEIEPQRATISIVLITIEKDSTDNSHSIFCFLSTMLWTFWIWI